MMKVLLMLVVSLVVLLFFGCSQQREQVAGVDLHEQQVQYEADGDTLNGYLVYDNSAEGKRPGVLVVHEWWGQNEYARERARMLAELGYTAFALDMYGKGKLAQHPDDAGKFATEAMQHMDVSTARFMAALDLLKSNQTVDPSKIAAIGYCFGGGIVIQMAVRGVDLRGVVSFHGLLPQGLELDPTRIKAKILVCNGADDPLNPKDQVDVFNTTMEDAGINYQFINYPGAVHSFTNPMADSLGKKFDMPLAYNETADHQSWEEMKEFFSRIFAN